MKNPPITAQQAEQAQWVQALVQSISPSSAPPALGKQAEFLFTEQLRRVQTTMEIITTPSAVLAQQNMIQWRDTLPPTAKVACQGLAGAYSHLAAERLFGEPMITFFDRFEEVAIALEQGHAEYGILPFENSSVGTVADITQYVYKHNTYINTMVPVKIEHCLCIHPHTNWEDVTTVISHPQALMQCQGTLNKMGLVAKKYPNTAMAAEKVSQGDEPLACLCSLRSAALYGLIIVEKNMQDISENYTRFVCIAREAVVFPKADTISLALSFSSEPGALGNLLLQFMMLNLDLTRIQSLPIAGPNFMVRFHLDFTGNIKNPDVANLLGHMYEMYDDFRFLGNYISIPPQA